MRKTCRTSQTGGKSRGGGRSPRSAPQAETAAAAAPPADTQKDAAAPRQFGAGTVLDRRWGRLL